MNFPVQKRPLGGLNLIMLCDTYRSETAAFFNISPRNSFVILISPRILPVIFLLHSLW